jgi:hypothetical protein
MKKEDGDGDGGEHFAFTASALTEKGAQNLQILPLLLFKGTNLLPPQNLFRGERPL